MKFLLPTFLSVFCLFVMNIGFFPLESYFDSHVAFKSHFCEKVLI